MLLDYHNLPWSEKTLNSLYDYIILLTGDYNLNLDELLIDKKVEIMGFLVEQKLLKQKIRKLIWKIKNVKE